jgi:hypothetical protein
MNPIAKAMIVTALLGALVGGIKQYRARRNIVGGAIWGLLAVLAGWYVLITIGSLGGSSDQDDPVVRAGTGD